VNLVRVGRVVRTLRRNRGWRQVDLARRAVCSQQLVSAIEAGRRVSLPALERVAHCLEAELELFIRWHGGQLERLLDEGHAELVALTATLLERRGWLVRLEVSYEIGRSSGSIDLLAFNVAASALLVVEVKTELLGAEATLRKHDEKTRLAASIASRFGWHPMTVSRLLVLPATTTVRVALDRRADLFGRAYPRRGREASRWLRDPVDRAEAILTIPITRPAGATRDLTSRRRIRRPNAGSPEHAARGRGRG
jgi:transcriptional regulator with XRE-family HTH domain